MATLDRDDFDGTGSGWDTTNYWVYAQYQSSTQTPVQTRSSGIGVLTGFNADYKYGRYYFGGDVLTDHGIRIRHRFGAGNSTNEMIRFFLRGTRTGKSDLDYTFPATGYVITFLRTSSTFDVQRLINSNDTSLASPSIGSAPGTAWWNLRAEIENSVLRIRYWLDNVAEPSTWQYSANIGTTIASGEPGFGVGYYANQINNFDYFETYSFQRVITAAGTIGSSGAEISVTRKNPFTATVASSGVFSKIKVATRVFAGAIASSAELKRMFPRAFAGSVQPTAPTVTKLPRIGTGLAGTVTSSARIKFTPIRRFASTVATAGVAALQNVGRIFGEAGYVKVLIDVAGEIRSWISKE